MENWVIANRHVIGTSHTARQQPCEDYSLSHHGDAFALAVISDGHGDPACFRSGTGARLACEASLAAVSGFADTEKFAADAMRAQGEQALRGLEADILAGWLDLVRQDIREHPFTEEELEGLEESVATLYQSGARQEKAYGCTLVLAVVGAGFWFGVHIGDGRLVAAYEHGSYRQPVPWDEEGCVGNRSTSLCDSNALALFRHYYSEEMPLALFVASDGMDESFDKKGLYNCYFTIAYWLQNMEFAPAMEKLDELLPQVSEGGSGDDVAVACIVSSTAPVARYVESSQSAAARLEGVCRAVEGGETRLQELTAQKEAQQAAIERYFQEEESLRLRIEQLNRLREDCAAEIERLGAVAEKEKGSLEQAQGQLIKARAYKLRIDEYWSELEEGDENLEKASGRLDNSLAQDQPKEQDPPQKLVAEGTEN